MEPRMTLEDLVREFGRTSLDLGAGAMRTDAPFAELALADRNALTAVFARINELRTLCAQEAARPGHPDTRKIHIDDILRILDGEQ